MENYFVIMIMLSLLIAIRRFELLPLLVIMSASVADVAMLIDDIAIYYGVLSLASMVIAFMALMEPTALKCKISNCKLIYAILMVIQSIICFLLIPDLGYDYNEIVQYILIEYNESLWIIFTILGALDCGFYTNSTSGADGTHSNTRNNRTN